MSGDFVLQAIAFIAVIASFSTAIWKIFTAVDKLKSELEEKINRLERLILDVQHEQHLKQVLIDSLNDRLILAVNGVKEVAEHIRTRTRAESSVSKRKINQIEAFLVKTTQYELRQ